MFVSTPRDIVCHAEMERALLFARKQMDVIGRHAQGLWIPGSALGAAPE
jgi:hypothetical protein